MNQQAFAKLFDEACARTAVGQEGALSTASLGLLCRLEHLCSQFENPAKSDARLAAISVAREMLVEIIEFLLESGRVDGGISREILNNLVEHTKHVEMLLNEQTLAEMFGFGAEMRRTKDREYAWLGRDFAKTFQELFTLLDRQIESPQLMAEWHDSWAIVLNEFIVRW